MRMAFVMTSMNASASMTLVVFATVLGLSMNVAARTFLKATAIAMEINLMPLAFVEAPVQLMLTRMASAMTLMNALAPMTLVVSATVLEKFTSADVQTFLKATAIAMEINLMPLAFVEALVQLMLTRMASAMTLMNASAPMTHVVSATAQEKFTSADVQTFLKATAIVKGASLTPLGCVAVLVQLM